MVKEKISYGIARAKRGLNDVKMKADSAVVAAATATGATAMSNVGSCASGSNAISTAIGYLAIPVGLLGGVYLIMGLIHYAGANSDGDGPAKKKATNEIAGGGMVVAIAVALKPMATAILAAVAV